MALNPYDGSPAPSAASRGSEPVEGIVTKERINNSSTVLQSVIHNGPQLAEASPSLNTPCLWHKQRLNLYDGSPASIDASSSSGPTEGIVTREQISDGSTILQYVMHNVPQLAEASPSLNTPCPWHQQHRNHPQMEARPVQDNGAHILSPLPIHRPDIRASEVAGLGTSSVFQAESGQPIDERASEVASLGASSVSRAKNSQAIDEQQVQLNEGAGFQQFYRRNHPQTEVQPAQYNDAHIISPVPIHRSIISANEVASLGASSVSRAESSQAIDEQQVQLSEHQLTMGGPGLQQFYREVALLRQEIGKLWWLGVEVPPAYPGNKDTITQ
ncbi:hypothetical protein DXG01_000722 [Tephrocybe rancida]|nr:hypothetical protein DXG01_000722 [Tephrocybe rancida]